MKNLLTNIGHRGAFLILLSLAFIFYGLGLYNEPVGPANVHLLLNLPEWSVIWILSGVVILAGSFDDKDKGSFAIASLISGAWSARWFYIWIFHHDHNAWPILFTWVLVTLTIMLISTWPEYRIKEITDKQRE